MSKSIEPRGQVIPIARLGVSGMDRHPDGEGMVELRPRRRPERQLSIERGSDRGRGRGEGRLDRVPHGLEQHAAMGVDCGTQELEVAIDRFGHRVWSRSQSAVLPSMSVKRKVTVPDGNSGIVCLHRP